MHDLCDVAFSCHRVFQLKPISCQIEPVFDLLLETVTFVNDFFKDLNSFIKIVPCIIDIDKRSANGSILKNRKINNHV